jgi:hypothetical protein
MREKIIKNFPKNYPFYKRIIAEMEFLFADFYLTPRENLLSKKDISNTRKKLKKGDIILSGNFRTAFGKLLREPVTHASVYVGRNKVIQARGIEGVIYEKLKPFLKRYDSLAILRIPKKTKRRRKTIKITIKELKKELKKPFDFEFKKGEESYFCSKLVNESFKKAKYDTKVKTFKRSKSLIKTKKIIHPQDFVKGNFEIIFLSHNLKLVKKQLKLIPEKN